MTDISRRFEAWRERIEKLRYKTGQVWHSDEEKRLENYTEQFFLKEVKPLLKEGKTQEVEDEIERFIEQVRSGEWESRHDTLSPGLNSPRIKDLTEEEAKEVLFYEIFDWCRKVTGYLDEDIKKGNIKYHGRVKEPYERAEDPKFRLDDFEDGHERFVNEDFVSHLLGKVEKRRKVFGGLRKIGTDVGVPADEMETVDEMIDMLEKREELLMGVEENLQNGDLESARKGYGELLEIIDQE